MFRLFRSFVLIGLSLSLMACGGDEPSTDESGEKLTKVILMSDWYPQPEHGGFYQALAKGYFEEAGLDVEIRSGANIKDIRPFIASDKVQFGMGTSDVTLIGISRGLPLVGLMPYFQHDPQCIMAHADSGITKINDLDGKEVMAQPSLSYIEYMINTLGLDIQLIPLDFSLSRFVTNPDFIQQCFVTSEPIILKHKGIATNVIPLSESGFDPYRHLYTNTSFLKDNPEVVTAFVTAARKGWNEFITADPTPALELIAQVNSQQSMTDMLETVKAMQEYKLVTGKGSEGDQLGKYQLSRLEKQVSQLKELGLINDSVSADSGTFAIDALPSSFSD